MSLPPEAIQYQKEHIKDNLQPNLYAASFICLPAAFIFVGLRFYARRLTPGGLGKDDLAILFALLFTSSFVATCVWVTVLGMGRQQILMDPANWVTYVKYQVTLAAEILYNPAIFFTKLSILLLYRRIFPSKTFNRILWGVGTFILAYTITSSTVNLLQCIPIAANWDPKLAATARCVDFGSELIALSTINAVTDLILLVLPMPKLWGLHVSFNKKIQLMAMFALGTATVVVSIIRANYVSSVSFTNGTWNNAFGAVWSIVETCLAIVCACLPTLKPLYERAFGKGGSDTKGSSAGRLIYPLSGPTDGSGDGFKMKTLGSKSADASYPGKSSVAESIYTEDSGPHPFTRLRDDV
ncbi:hypothetical protein K458DRAFT_320974 [Lentithecium fluviatile CBS 122367]|uniref:Rhodopsin domain-containing protein n=1 Tax=Lentithecium fluviatile CBS 122367 TaxID=1168545 RepID=A0A6G1IFV3_9PLEO|nr:hypothetical protein K458DRAFT_320974 [Lentithecium fluviatile CBS 122367]